jgi:hypothetical protein
MILKLFYTAFYYARVNRSQHAKLARMKAEPNIILASHITHSGKSFFCKGSNIGLPPKPLPTRLSVYRKYIT